MPYSQQWLLDKESLLGNNNTYTLLKVIPMMKGKAPSSVVNRQRLIGVSLDGGARTNDVLFGVFKESTTEKSSLEFANLLHHDVQLPFRKIIPSHSLDPT
jgi:hypothetical protein